METLSARGIQHWSKGRFDQKIIWVLNFRLDPGKNSGDLWYVGFVTVFTAPVFTALHVHRYHMQQSNSGGRRGPGESM
jgi:hypothetical protein